MGTDRKRIRPLFWSCWGYGVPWQRHRTWEDDYYKKGLWKIIVATEVDPNEEMLDLMVHSLKLGNFPFVYAFATYFIASVEQNPD